MSLVFDKEKVLKTKDHLARLLAQVFYRRKVTEDDLVQLFFTYWRLHRTSEPYSKASVRLNNIRTVIQTAHSGSKEFPVTWKSFANIVFLILNLPVVRFSVTLADPITNEEFTINSDDPIEEDNT